MKPSPSVVEAASLLALAAACAVLATTVAERSLLHRHPEDALLIIPQDAVISQGEDSGFELVVILHRGDALLAEEAAYVLQVQATSPNNLIHRIVKDITKRDLVDGCKLHLPVNARELPPGYYGNVEITLSDAYPGLGR